jgi:hypothetical protein
MDFDLYSFFVDNFALVLSGSMDVLKALRTQQYIVELELIINLYIWSETPWQTFI